MSRNTQFVLGVDRTFNLGKCFVTATTFKCDFVFRRTSGNYPLFMGFVLLHWDGLSKTYDTFFGHLRELLTQHSDNLQNLKTIFFGSDEEAALIKSIKTFFSSSRHLLCARHMRQNITKFLQDKVGLDHTKRNWINEQIFGSEGLLKSEDSTTFDTRAEQLMDDLIAIDNDSLLHYMTRKMLSMLKQQANNTDHFGMESIWTNNNFESINHVLKLTTN